MSFKEVKPEELTMNPFTKIGKEWLLITAGNEEKCNTMTASWGAMGVMWGKNAVTVYIRPQRYTKEFVDREETFTISVLGEQYRKALSYCGKVTGKDMDKITEAVKLGVAMAGGTPIMVPAIAVCDGIAMGHIGMKYSLVTRDLIADSTEALAMAHQFDGLVMIPNCDKNVPGLLMAAAG